MRWLWGVFLASMVSAVQAETTAQNFGEWTLLCSPCMVGLNAVSGNADEVKVTVVVWNKEQQTVVLFNLPREAKARPHMTIAVDQTLHKFLPLTCDQENCLALWKPRGREVATLLWSKTLTLEFKMGADEGWQFPIPLAGLNDAFVALAAQQ